MELDEIDGDVVEACLDGASSPGNGNGRRSLAVKATFRAIKV